MDTVMWVDDDRDLLVLIGRWLGHDYELYSYADAREALAALKVGKVEPAVIVADMNMPGMDGAGFLALAADASPHAVRMMFTGAEDQVTAQKAVNEGHVFRFLTKGVDIGVIRQTVDDAVHEYAQREAERRVLEDTTIGAVRALMDVLAMTQPAAFGRATRIRQTVAGMAQTAGLKSWQVELGATLSQLGCIALPSMVMERIAEGREVAPVYEKMFLEHPRVGAELIRKIPRLQPIADIVLFQHKHFTGGGFPEGGRARNSIPLGSRMLKVAVDYDRLMVAGVDVSAALTRMRSRDGWYDNTMLDHLEHSRTASPLERRIVVSIAEMQAGMVLAERVETEDGVIVATEGQAVTQVLAARLAANSLLNDRFVVLAA